MEKQQKILVVDDEEDILELVRYNLAKEGFDVECVDSGEECLKASLAFQPDLIVLDLMLPGLTGLDVCRRLKADPRYRAVPVVMLTAKGEESDIVAGLDLGADDYIVKPFAPRVLLARIQAVLRRAPRIGAASGVVCIDQLLIDPERHECTVDGSAIALTATEFRLLHALAGHPGTVFTRSRLVRAAHGENYPVTDRSIDVQIVNLRRKLGRYGDLIETVRGIGYRFTDIERR